VVPNPPALDTGFCGAPKADVVGLAGLLNENPVLVAPNAGVDEVAGFEKKLVGFG